MTDKNNSIIGIVVIVVIAFVIIFLIVNKGNSKLPIKQSDSISPEKEILDKLSFKKFDVLDEDDYAFFKSLYCNENGFSLSIIVSFEEIKNNCLDIESCLKSNVIITLDDEVSDIEEVDINGIKWNKITITKKDNVTEYYITEKYEHFYLVELDLWDYYNGDREDIDTNKCLNASRGFMNSISFNK